jgi:hypothetical protein
MKKDIIVQPTPNIERDGNRLYIHKLTHAKCVSDFLYHLKDVISKGYQEVILLGSPPAVFPNALLPICGIIEYYKSIGYSFTNQINTDYLQTSGFMNPFDMSIDEIQSDNNPFDKIFLFRTDQQVDAITQAYVDTLSRKKACEEGVIDGIQWCISEIMDNVLTHSDNNYGLIMAQIHPRTSHIAFCIYDVGIGIYKTLAASKHKPATESDALSLSIQEGIGDGKGQGNGMYGLYQIVKNNKGTLTITSGRSSLMMKGEGEIQKFDHIPYIDNTHRSTTVDFQLDLNRKINMQEAFRTIGGDPSFDFRIDNMLSFEDEDVHYSILKNAQGTATRQSGLSLRNDIINIFRRTHRRMILDFDGIKNVSSSFIDELIAKLIINFGMIEFMQIFIIINMNEDIRYLCNRSIYMRIHDEWDAKIANRTLE